MEDIENSVDFSVSNEEIIIGDYIEMIALAPQEYNLKAYTIELLENEDAKICSICLDALQMETLQIVCYVAMFFMKIAY